MNQISNEFFLLLHSQLESLQCWFHKPVNHTLIENFPFSNQCHLEFWEDFQCLSWELESRISLENSEASYWRDRFAHQTPLLYSWLNVQTRYSVGNMYLDPSAPHQSFYFEHSLDEYKFRFVASSYRSAYHKPFCKFLFASQSCLGMCILLYQESAIIISEWKSISSLRDSS
jgi:hypothetical protein